MRSVFKMLILVFLNYYGTESVLQFHFLMEEVTRQQLHYKLCNEPFRLSVSLTTHFFLAIRYIYPFSGVNQENY